MVVKDRGGDRDVVEAGDDRENQSHLDLGDGVHADPKDREDQLVEVGEDELRLVQEQTVVVQRMGP